MSVTDLESFLASFDGESGYLDWAAFGPLSTSVRADAHADTELLGSGRTSSLDLVSEHLIEARELVAELIGSDAEQVVLQPSTTYGLMQAIYGLAGGLMLSRAEFPSLTVTATRAADALGSIDVQWIDPDDGFVTPEAVRDALTDDTRAVAVSLVDFRTGYRADLTALRDVIGDRLLIVDAIQGFGAVVADYLGCGCRVRQRVQVAARRAWHGVRVVQRARARADLARALRLRGNRRRSCRSTEVPAAGTVGAGVHRAHGRSSRRVAPRDGPPRRARHRARPDRRRDQRPRVATSCTSPIDTRCRC